MPHARDISVFYPQLANPIRNSANLKYDLSAHNPGPKTYVSFAHRKRKENSILFWTSIEKNLIESKAIASVSVAL